MSIEKFLGGIFPNKTFETPSSPSVPKTDSSPVLTRRQFIQGTAGVVGSLTILAAEQQLGIGATAQGAENSADAQTAAAEVLTAPEHPAFKELNDKLQSAATWVFDNLDQLTTDQTTVQLERARDAGDLHVSIPTNWETQGYAGFRHVARVLRRAYGKAISSDHQLSSDEWQTFMTAPEDKDAEDWFPPEHQNEFDRMVAVISASHSTGEHLTTADLRKTYVDNGETVLMAGLLIRANQFEKKDLLTKITTQVTTSENLINNFPLTSKEVKPGINGLDESNVDFRAVIRTEDPDAGGAKNYHYIPEAGVSVDARRSFKPVRAMGDFLYADGGSRSLGIQAANSPREFRQQYGAAVQSYLELFTAATTSWPPETQYDAKAGQFYYKKEKDGALVNQDPLNDYIGSIHKQTETDAQAQSRLRQLEDRLMGEVMSREQHIASDIITIFKDRAGDRVPASPLDSFADSLSAYFNPEDSTPPDLRHEQPIKALWKVYLSGDQPQTPAQEMAILTNPDSVVSLLKIASAVDNTYEGIVERVKSRASSLGADWPHEQGIVQWDQVVWAKVGKDGYTYSDAIATDFNQRMDSGLSPVRTWMVQIAEASDPAAYYENLPDVARSAVKESLIAITQEPAELPIIENHSFSTPWVDAHLRQVVQATWSPPGPSPVFEHLVQAEQEAFK